ncbi:TPA: hypothetical protein ACFU11_002185 [Neisseria subflava]
MPQFPKPTTPHSARCSSFVSRPQDHVLVRGAGSGVGIAFA